MSYFAKRRAEILGKRKRKPRRCDLARQETKLRERLNATRRQLYAIRRLERAWA